MRVAILLVLLLLGNMPVRAGEGPLTCYLIPQPKRIIPQSGRYDFSHPYSIKATPGTDGCMQQLVNTITRKFKTHPLNEVNHIKLVVADTAGLARVAESERLTLPFALDSEGYILSISPEAISVIAPTSAGVFYGVQTLLQLIEANSEGSTIPCLVIYDKPDMAIRGWQDDISRGPIPTMDFLKEEIQRMASFKLNTFTLYTEHVFKLKKHPGIAPPDGITAEQIEELTAFAKNYHVDIIGNFQSFGHFANILKVPGYEKLGENANTLSPAKEESYQFLSDVYSEVVPAYESPYFHINCDEVSLSNGPSKKMIDTIGIDGVYAYHINRINALLKPYHKRMMMWGDIAVKNPKIIDRLPKDMIIVSWGYAEMESMDEDILPFVQSGFQFIVAPGVSCWSNIYPDMQRASINIYNYLRDGYKNGCMGFINTTWDDDGQNLFNNNWYSLTWGADCGWNAPANKPVKESEAIRTARVASFNRSYNRVYYHTDTDITSLLTATANLKYGPVSNCLYNNRLWNALLPDYSIIPDNYERDNLNLITSIDSLCALTAKWLPQFHDKRPEADNLLFALRQARVVAGKNLLGIQLKRYISSGAEEDISSFAAPFAALTDTMQALKSEYVNLWNRENRHWWLDTVLAYYDHFPQSFDALKGVCIITASDTLLNGMRQIQLRSAFNHLPVYYTTDGSVPSRNAMLYTQPILADSNITITASVLDGDRMYVAQCDSFVYHKGIGRLYKLNSEWWNLYPTYAARGPLGLLDGRRGSHNNFNDGRWQAYLRIDIDVELDLGEVMPVKQVTMGFGQLMRYGVLYPKQIEVSTSEDGIHYTLADSVVNTLEPNTEQRSTHDFVIALKKVRTRYLKVVARNTGILPEWHYAKGKPATLFADEIVVE